jgi:DNA-binding NtrC family response regulator
LAAAGYAAGEQSYYMASGGFMAKLLIVDDDKNIRETLATFFRTCGHHVRTFENGQEALAAFAEDNDFELILSDCRMEKINGLELLRRTKLSAPKIPFILMTAYGSIESAIEALRAGAIDYVIKPFSLEKIQHVVHRALGVHNFTTCPSAIAYWRTNWKMSHF